MRRALVLACALFVPACTRELFDSDDFVQRDLSGSLRLPLSTHVDGVTYALRDATLELSGTAMLTLSADPRAEALTTPLPSGSYGMFLRPGFRVVAIDEQGVERPLAARLSSQNPARVHVGEVDDMTVKLTFEHPAGKIVFGAAPALRVTSAL